MKVEPEERREEIERLEYEIFKKRREIGLLEDRVRGLGGVVM